MSGLFATISNANRAVIANQYAIEVTSHNVANANTEGYRRQSVVMKTGVANSIGIANWAGSVGQLGTGVVLDSIDRYTNIFLDQRYRLEISEQKKYEFKSQILTQLESMLSETTETGLISKLDDFWDAWQSLADDPTSDALRSLVREQGRQIAMSFSSRMETLNDIAENQEINVLDRVMEINSIADKITNLNIQIGHAVSGGLQPNDLLDTRDLLLDRLAEVAGGVSYENKWIQNINTGEWFNTGQINVSIGGHILVGSGSFPHKLSYNTITNTFEWEDGQPYNGTSGELQGVVDAIDIINDQKDRLNELANGLIKWVNDLHQATYQASDPLNVINSDVVLNINAGGNFWLGGNGTASVDTGLVEDPDSVLDGAAPIAASAVLAGVTELGTGDYIVETRSIGGVLQFRLLNVEGQVVGIDDGSGTGNLTKEWQIYTGGSSHDTGRGLTITFNAVATDGVQVRVNYTAAGINLTDPAYVGVGNEITATDTLSTIAQKINNSLNLQSEGRQIQAIVIENQLLLVPYQPGANHSVIANSDLTTAGVVPPDGNIAAGDPILNFPSGVTTNIPPRFFEGEDDPLGPAYSIRLSTAIEDSYENVNASNTPITTGDGSIAQAIADGRYSRTFPVGIIEGTTLYQRENANDFYNAQVTKVGLEIKYANAGVEDHGTIADALFQQRESFCGVNLEEEAINLLKYQRAFQAAARVIEISNELLGRIIDGLAS